MARGHKGDYKEIFKQAPTFVGRALIDLMEFVRAKRKVVLHRISCKVWNMVEDGIIEVEERTIDDSVLMFITKVNVDRIKDLRYSI